MSVNQPQNQKQSPTLGVNQLQGKPDKNAPNNQANTCFNSQQQTNNHSSTHIDHHSGYPKRGGQVRTYFQQNKNTERGRGQRIINTYFETDGQDSVVNYDSFSKGNNQGAYQEEEQYEQSAPSNYRGGRGNQQARGGQQIYKPQQSAYQRGGRGVKKTNYPQQSANYYQEQNEKEESENRIDDWGDQNYTYSRGQRGERANRNYNHRGRGGSNTYHFQQPNHNREDHQYSQQANAHYPQQRSRQQNKQQWAPENGQQKIDNHNQNKRLNQKPQKNQNVVIQREGQNNNQGNNRRSGGQQVKNDNLPRQQLDNTLKNDQQTSNAQKDLIQSTIQQNQPKTCAIKDHLMKGFGNMDGQKKCEICEMYQVRMTQDKTPMPLLQSYKDFVVPQFFQGPKYNFIKEVAIGSTSKQVRKQQDAEARKVFDFIQEWPLNNDNDNDLDSINEIEKDQLSISPISSSTRPVLSLQRFDSVEAQQQTQTSSSKLEAEQMEHANRFDLNRERKAGNQFWKQGTGRDEHRALEMAAKAKRLARNEIVQDYAKEEEKSQERPVQVDDQGCDLYPGQLLKRKFEGHIADKDEIEIGLANGKYFKGIMRVNQGNRRRAFVTVDDLKIDVYIDGIFAQNQALDGDTVVIEIQPPFRWHEYPNPTSLTVTSSPQFDFPSKFQIVEAMIQNKKRETSAFDQISSVQVLHSSFQNDRSPLYENNAPIEQRIVDTLATNQDSQAVVEDEEPQKFTEFIAVQKEYNKHKFQVRGNSSSQDEAVQEHEETKQDAEPGRPIEDIQVIDYVYEESSLSQKSQFRDEKKSAVLNSKKGEKSKSKEPAQLNNRSTFKIDETSRETRINSINRISKEFRPIGKVVAILMSPNMTAKQLVTLKIIDKEMLNPNILHKLNKKQITANNEDNPKKVRGQKTYMMGLYAVSVSTNKLPWMQVTSAPKELIIDLKAKKNYMNRYYLAKIKEWNKNDLRPTVDILQSIGEAGDLKTESIRLLHTFDICPDQYEQDQEEDQTVQKLENWDDEDSKLEERKDENIKLARQAQLFDSLKVFFKDINAKTGEWIIPQQEINRRLDLRQKRIFTIDPITAMDLDDALSIDHVEGDIYEVGVHIADVSYFVTQGSELDREAQLRCTSTYFVHKVFSMLPRILCEKLCSLNRGVDRLAYSVFFRIFRSSGELLKDFKPVIRRSVIRSCAKWHYQLVQDMLDKKIFSENQLPLEFKPSSDQKFEDLLKDCFLMNEIAQRRRKIRMSKGSIQLHNPEFKFQLDQKTKMPLSFIQIQMIDSKFLVEEFMLLCNTIVAEFIRPLCQEKTLLRVHQDITDNKKKQLGFFFERVNMSHLVDLTDSLTVNQSLERIKNHPNPKLFQVAIRKLFASLTAAQYITIEQANNENFLSDAEGKLQSLSHYGLNFELYTHFTSPIRRYSDLLVHRLVTICLQHGADTRKFIENIDYSQLAQKCSEKSIASKQASTQCTKMFHCLLLKNQGGVKVCESLIFDIDSQFLHIQIEDFNLQYKLRVKDDPRIDSTVFFEDSLKLVASLKSKMKRVSANDLVQLQNQKHQANKSLESKILQEGCPFDEHGNLTFNVFDTVKIKIETTNDFPLDLKCTLMFTQEDLAEYSSLLRSIKNEKKLEEDVMQGYLCQDQE